MLAFAVALAVACLTALIMACFVLAVDMIWRAKQRRRGSASTRQADQQRLMVGFLGL